MGLESFWGSNEAALARTLLEPERADLARDARRFSAGLALASVFGLALGSRFGAVSMAAHAVGVPLAIVVVALLGTPASAGLTVILWPLWAPFALSPRQGRRRPERRSI